MTLRQSHASDRLPILYQRFRAFFFLQFFMTLGASMDGYSYRGCYSVNELQSRLTSMGTYQYQSVTYCQEQCNGRSIAALLNGSECFCGDSLSILDGLYPTGGEECSVDCSGWPFVKCGGTAAMDVYVNDNSHEDRNDDANKSNNDGNGDNGAAVQYTSVPTRSLLQESMFEQHTDTARVNIHPPDTAAEGGHQTAEKTSSTPHLLPLTVTEERTMMARPETSVSTVFVTLTPSPKTFAVTETTVEVTPIVIPIVSSVEYTRTVFTSLLYTVSNRVPTTIVMFSTVVYHQQPTTSYVYSTLTKNEELTLYSILVLNGTTMTKLVTSTYTPSIRPMTVSSNGTLILSGSRSPTTHADSVGSRTNIVTTAGRGFSVTSLTGPITSRVNSSIATIGNRENSSSFGNNNNGTTSEFSPYNRSTSGTHGLSGGAIAGIVIGCIFGTILVLPLLLFLFLLRKRMYNKRMRRLNLGNEETKYYQPYSFGINDSAQPPMVPFGMLTPRGSHSLSPRAASNQSNYSRGLHMHNPLVAMSTGGEHLNRAGSGGADISKNVSGGSGNNTTFADVVRSNLLPPSFYNGENLTSVTSFPDMGMENRLHIVNPDNPNDVPSSDGNKEDDIDIDSTSSI